MKKYSELVPKEVETNLIFFVNGKKVVESNPDPEWTLLWYIRKKLQLTGSKYGCGEGGCGACTVMVSQYNREKNLVKHYAVNACLMPLCAMHGMAVITIEGIGSTQTKLHPIQERIAKTHGSQCGFCTPGIIMSMYALLRNKNEINYADIETALQGNLCRCTGYRPIIEGFKTFMEDFKNCYVSSGVSSQGCALGENCCQRKAKDNPELYNKSSFQPYDPSQEPIFPPELKLNSKTYESYLFYQGSNIVWLRPTNMEELSHIKCEYPHSKIVVGNTEIGVEIKFKKMHYPILLSTNLIEEMKVCKVTDEGIIVGASTTLSDLKYFLQEVIERQKEPKAEVFHAIVDMLHWFAGNQVRNVASIAGNIVTASPISDLNPIFMACGAILNIYTPGKGYRNVTIDEHFFKSYRQTEVKKDEIVLSVKLPFTQNCQYFKAFKQARRRDDDISIVTAAFNVKFECNNNTITEAKLCFGGMGPTTLFAKETAAVMKGMLWNENMLSTVLRKLTEELQLDESAPGGMPLYRKSLCLSLFFKFFLQITQSSGYGNVNSSKLEFIHSIPESSQLFEINGLDRKSTDVVGLPVIHTSAFKQVTGEAIYCDDIPVIDGELFLTLIFSAKAHAKIVSIDAEEALSMPGVVAFYCYKDLHEESNKGGPLIQDEEIFSSSIVTSRACVIGAIVARTELIARKAKDYVKVIYEDLSPVIITLEDAIENKSFYSGYPKTLKKGDVSKAFEEADFSLENICRSSAQEHFYLETNAALVIRKEDDLEIYTTTQSPSEIGHSVSRALNIPRHRIITKVKRIGGGFGGKETRNSILVVPVSIAAYKLRKPVRATFDRDEDMQVTGYRHPHLIKYKVAFNKNGKIVGAIFDIYNNAGNSMDLSCAVNERASFHIDNCYFIPNFIVNGYVCKTNLVTSTAFRGFGAPQAMLATETMIRDVADALGKTYEEMVSINMYQEGDLTHFNQILRNCTIKRCWNECIVNCDYWKRKENVNEFNRSNRWKKKGIALVPTKYGISFQSDVLMQGGVLILIYNDGSVLLTLGGIEMGQGLFTKMIQVASRVLEIDSSKIHINETSTDKVPNTSATAASINSDLYGMAVINACNIIMERLNPFKNQNSEGKWEDWVLEAYVNRVNLSATGFYAAPKIEYNFDTNSGDAFLYLTYGVACSEVLIDCLTGDHQVLRTDIVMDIGESLNPAIDIGQIEGAFIQGYGFYTMEELVFSPQGELYSRGPGTYKIPGFSDIPKKFNVSLLKGAPNPRAVYSSKAVGEPPLFLAASVFFSIKEAIRAARVDAKVSPIFNLKAPATCERIRMACEDHITKQVEPSIKKTGISWNVMA